MACYTKKVPQFIQAMNCGPLLFLLWWRFKLISAMGYGTDRVARPHFPAELAGNGKKLRMGEVERAPPPLELFAQVDLQAREGKGVFQAAETEIRNQNCKKQQNRGGTGHQRQEGKSARCHCPDHNACGQAAEEIRRRQRQNRISLPQGNVRL